MNRRHQIVDRLPTSADDDVVVLFDFDEHFTVRDETSISPPEMRYATSSTFLHDGENVDASAFNNRTLNLSLGGLRGNAEVQAEAIQRLGSLLADPRGQWFLWQDEGTVDPRFFRTYPASMSINDMLLLENPKRVITLPIPAEPFARGYPESGEVTISNDPTAADNPMTALLTGVKGDVATPLWLHGTSDMTTLGWWSLLAMSCMPAGSAAGLPIYTDDFDFTDDTLPSGWSASNTADATAVSGVRKRITTGTFGGDTTVESALTSWLTDIPRGDYRLLIRAKASSMTFPVHLAAAVYDASTTASDALGADRTVPGTDWAWMDFGVVRAPRYGPPSSVLLDQNPSSSSNIIFHVNIGSFFASASLDVDAALLVPVGLDEAIDTRTMPLRGNNTATDLWLDSLNEIIYLRATTGDAMYPVAPGGAFPRVVPGADNHLNFMRLINTPGDDKTKTTTFAFTYIPLYLYTRSATG